MPGPCYGYSPVWSIDLDADILAILLAYLLVVTVILRLLRSRAPKRISLKKRFFTGPVRERLPSHPVVPPSNQSRAPLHPRTNTRLSAEGSDRVHYATQASP